MNNSSVMPKWITLAFFPTAMPNQHSGGFQVWCGLCNRISLFYSLGMGKKSRPHLAKAVTPKSQMKEILITRNKRTLNYFWKLAPFCLFVLIFFSLKKSCSMIDVQAVLVLGVQQSDSILYMYLYILFQILSHYNLL